MKKQDVNTVINVYSIIFYVIAVLYLIGFFFMSMMSGTFFSAGFMHWAFPFASVAFFGMSLFVLALGIFMIVAANLLKKKREGGRILVIILSVLMLFGFPFGTLIGGFGIYFFAFNKDIARAFR